MAKRPKEEFVVGDFVAVWGNLGVPCGRGAAVPVTAANIPRLRRQYAEWNGEQGTIYRLVPVTVAEVKAQAARERKAGKRKGSKR